VHLSGLYCKPQSAGIQIFSPEGLVRAMSISAKKQFRPFNPAPDATRRVLTIVSQGCVNDGPIQPVCQSITRVVLLSDSSGGSVVEGIESHVVPDTWQNGFGATEECASLISKFAMNDVRRVLKNRELIVATFQGGQLLKLYKVKEKQLKILGL
jgi:hypothetical protein